MPDQRKKKKLLGYRKWEQEAPRLSNSKTAGSVIQNLLDQLGVRDQVEESKVVLIWPEVVGQTIARVTEAQAIEHGVLTVKVSNATWRHELTYLKREITTNLNRALGKSLVSDIKFL